jgi:hypothetical protein
MVPGDFKEVTERCHKLASDGDVVEALRLADEALQHARDTESLWVAALARQASLFARILRDDALRLKYLHYLLALNAEDALAHFGVAEALLAIGHPDQALEHAATAYRITKNSGGATDMALVELIERKWPELAG